MEWEVFSTECTSKPAFHTQRHWTLSLPGFCFCLLGSSGVVLVHKREGSFTPLRLELHWPVHIHPQKSIAPCSLLLACLGWAGLGWAGLGWAVVSLWKPNPSSLNPPPRTEDGGPGWWLEVGYFSGKIYFVSFHSSLPQCPVRASRPRWGNRVL